MYSIGKPTEGFVQNKNQLKQRDNLDLLRYSYYIIDTHLKKQFYANSEKQ